jgi:hypothetical protein
VNGAVLTGLSLDAFEQGEIDPEAFDHEAHVYMAWRYLERFPMPVALEKFDDALRRLTVKLGVPGKYHATITWFFLLLIGERRSAEPGADWQTFRQRNADLVEDRSLLRRYYSRQTLASDRARQAFVLPDPDEWGQSKHQGARSSCSAEKASEAACRIVSDHFAIPFPHSVTMC